MNLLIDVGNSCLKWAVAGGGDWDGGHAAPIVRSVGLFTRCWGRLRAPDRIMVSNVLGAPFAADLTGWCVDRWQRTPAYLRVTKSCCGIINSYSEPGELGADRWAALIGARTLASGALCVIDCGTAVTVDVLSDENVFLGGAILPGSRLARDSLLHQTQGIKQVGGLPASVFGRSTAECVGVGVHYGLVGAVERLIDEIQISVDSPLGIYLTGGGAHELRPALGPATRLEPDLVLIGLAEVLVHSR